MARVIELVVLRQHASGAEVESIEEWPRWSWVVERVSARLDQRLGEGAGRGVARHWINDVTPQEDIEHFTDLLEVAVTLRHLERNVERIDRLEAHEVGQLRAAGNAWLRARGVALAADDELNRLAVVNNIAVPRLAIDLAARVTVAEAELGKERHRLTSEV